MESGKSDSELRTHIGIEKYALGWRETLTIRSLMHLVNLGDHGYAPGDVYSFIYLLFAVRRKICSHAFPRNMSSKVSARE